MTTEIPVVPVTVIPVPEPPSRKRPELFTLIYRHDESFWIGGSLQETVEAVRRDIAILRKDNDYRSFAIIRIPAEDCKLRDD